MFVKFRTDTYGDGEAGFRNAILTIATAPAGTPPARPARTEYWEVVDHSVAGGWTLSTARGDQHDLAVDFSSGTAASYRWAIESNTWKTAIDPKGYKKGLCYYGNGEPSGYNTGYLQAYQVDNNNTVVTSRTITQTTGHNASYEYARTFVSGTGTSQINDFTWYVLCTEEYIWIYREHAPGQGDNASPTQSWRYLGGVSDLTFATDWEQTAGSSHFPVGGFWQMPTGASTSEVGYQWTYGHDAQVTAYGMNHQNESYNGRYGSVISWSMAVNVDSANSMTRAYAIPLWPATADSNGVGTAGDSSPSTTQYYKSGWDEKGFDRISLTDCTFMSPLTGWNARRLKGIKLGGWNRYLNTYALENLHGNIVSSGGSNYMLLNVHKILYGLKIN